MSHPRPESLPLLLTDLAGRYTDDRHDNFDTYRPLWLARYNKLIFGTFFAASEVLVLARCLTSPC